MTTTPSTNSSCHRLLIATAPLLTVSAGALLYRYLVCSRKPQSQSQSRASTLARSENPYETPSQLHEYLLMHFGTPSELFCHEDVTDIPRSSFDFPKQCAIECMKLLKESSWTVNERRVLDVGCAVGRSTFELAHESNEVIGLDYSHSFVDAANELKSEGTMKYLVRVEGDITTSAVANVDDSIDRSRVSFVQGDACNLDSSLGKFHLIMGANLLCRLPYPRSFLESLPNLTHMGGFVVLFSPHTWLTSYTDKSEWIGGYYDTSGAPVRTADRLKQIMNELGFDFISEKNMPFFIHETYRKNQWSVSHMTAFKRIR